MAPFQRQIEISNSAQRAMDLSELRDLIRQGRGQAFDWHPREVSAPALAESLVALANGDGGTVLVGLTPRVGRPQGLREPEATIDIALRAALSITPPLIIPLPRILDMDGRTLLSITVPPGMPHVYSVDGKFLIRSGDRNNPLAPRALRRLMMARGKLSWEAQTPEGATLADLDWESVSAYVERLELPSDVSAETLLLQRGCVTNQGEDTLPTFAGLLLFGQDPQRWVRGAEIEMARFGGKEMSDAFVRQTIGGTIPDQLRQAEAFILDHMRTVVLIGAGLTRDERPEYPPEAAREALVNAVAHRDYSITGDQIRLFLFADRLEVTSPGHLPGPVTVDNIVDERFSRNEVIVQVLADMGFIERLGYGIDRMIRLMRESDLAPPRFRETAGGFRVILFSASETAPRPASVPDRELFALVELNLRQEQALAFILAHGRITNRDYQTLSPEVHPETLRRDLADLVSKDVLLKVGDKRATYYILKKTSAKGSNDAGK